MHAGFLQGSAHTRPLSPVDVDAIRRVFAAAYGGAPTDWAHHCDHGVSRIQRVGSAVRHTVTEGYAADGWVTDSLLAWRCLPESRAFSCDDEVLAAYACAGQPLSATRTAYVGVQRLTPRAGVQRRDDGTWGTYATPIGKEPALDRAFLCLDAAAEALREALRCAIVERLASTPADATVAVELSGGVDSTLIAAIARQVHPALVCVTVDASAIAPHRDAAWAARAAAALDLPLQRVPLDALRGGSDPTELHATQATVEPHAHPAWDTQRALLRYEHHALRASVVLTGHGADDLFALTPGELGRQRQTWGVADGVLQVARSAWRRRGLPSTQLLRTMQHKRRVADAWERVAPWYGAHVEPALRAMTARRLSLATATAWERLHHSAFYPWAAAGVHPGATGLPIRLVHPFLHPDVVALSRRIPPWPHFDAKAVLRRALEHEGLAEHARRPKELVASDIQIAAWQYADADEAAHAHTTLARVLEHAEQRLPTTPHTWADADALRHTFRHWRRYPRAVLTHLPQLLAVLHWSAPR